MSQASSCWCGNTNLKVFSPGYLRCPSCETLITRQMPNSQMFRVNDDERDFYGREYWFSHQERDLAQPNIIDRSRIDLTERGLYWLRTILRYKTPPGRALEIGSGHGAFVAMLRWTGFDATGLELSSWVVEFARTAFGVPTLLGPVEEQQIEPGTLDLIALMDVLEHLPNPLSTMHHCFSLLKPDGILAIQTPRYPEGKTYSEMMAEADRFLEQLKFNEHLYLFSQNSICEFFRRLKADYLAFEPAIFSHYDMFLLVSRVPLSKSLPEEIERVLGATPSSRFVQGLLDLDDRFQNLMSRYGELEACATARLESARQLERLLAESEADRAARLESVFKLERMLDESERDRAARQESIKELECLLAESEADRAARLESVFKLERMLDESERDRAARFEMVKTQETEINNLRSEIIYLTEKVTRLHEIVHVIRRSRVYRMLRRIGRWQFMDQAPNEPMGRDLPEGGQGIESCAGENTDPALEARLQRITVDLTPLLPGAENGGAKLVAIELVRHLSRLLPDCEFVLLTSEKSHDELAYLDCSNVQRKCVAGQARPPAFFSIPTHLRIWLQETLARLLPASFRVRLKSLYRSCTFIRRPTGAVKETKADLLFCPFTAPFFYEPSVATVCVMYDLQHRYYPQFFPAEERSHRNRYFNDVCTLASRVVCISDYVRQTVLANSELDPDHVVAIPIRLFSRLVRQSADTILQTLIQWTLVEGDFLLYPANFWPHKNHRLLFTAFSIYCRRYPGSKLKLVCTGAPDANMEKLRDAAERMNLKERIVFPGYLPDHEFAALLQSCRAVIFPSLYEGFGMPILEAMEFGKPVLCSNLTSLPEVGGDAPLYVDPRKPQEIVAAIERIVSDGGLAADMVRRGHAHLAALSGPEQMAQQYVQVFRDALLSCRSFLPTLQGVHADGWTGERIVVTYGAESGPRYLETSLHVPSWLPHDHVSITHCLNGAGLRKNQTVRRGESITIRDQLPSTDGFLEIMISPTFQPRVNGFNDDDRTLGCQCQGCSIVSEGKHYDLFKELSR